MKKSEEYLTTRLDKFKLDMYLWAALLLPPAVYFLSMLGYWFGISMSSAHALIALISIAGAATFRASMPNSGKFFLSCRIGLFLFLYSIFIVGLQAWFVDFSWDGRQYHAEAIAQLKLGWNPVYERLLPDQWGYGDPSVWLNVLPKFNWIIGASVYTITDRIGSTKILTLYYLIPIAFYVYILTRQHLNKIASLLISLLICANPVVLSQVFTNYIDAPAYLILVIFILSLIDLHKNSKVGVSTPWFAILFAISALAVKFTNIVPVFVIFLAGLLFSNQLRSSILRLYFVVFVAIVATAALYNPYITNLLRYGNVAYPIFSQPLIKQVNFPLNFAPEGVKQIIYDSNHYFFSSQTPVKALVLSIFSKSDNNNDAAQLKFPLEIRKSEWLQFGNPDVRVGGFGPFYAAGLVFGVLGLIAAFVSNRSIRWGLPLVAGCLLLVGVAFITPNSWWARYVPYLWFIPIIFSAIALRSVPLKLTWLPKLSLFLLMINVLIIATVVLIKNFRDSNYFNGPYLTSLRQQAQAEPLPIKCDFNRLLIDYRENAIPFYCTMLSRAIFNAYSKNSSDPLSLEKLYAVEINNAANLTNTRSRLDSVLFFGEVMSLKPDILLIDKDILVSFYNEPLRYSVQVHPPLGELTILVSAVFRLGKS